MLQSTLSHLLMLFPSYLNIGFFIFNLPSTKALTRLSACLSWCLISPFRLLIDKFNAVSVMQRQNGHIFPSTNLHQPEPLHACLFCPLLLERLLSKIRHNAKMVHFTEFFGTHTKQYGLQRSFKRNIIWVVAYHFRFPPLTKNKIKYNQTRLDNIGHAYFQPLALRDSCSKRLGLFLRPSMQILFFSECDYFPITYTFNNDI